MSQHTVHPTKRRCLQDQCAFNGAWGGGNRHPTAFYVSSYFWDRATDAGIIAEPEAIMWDLKPADLVKAATLACSTPVSGLAALFPKVRCSSSLPPFITQATLYGVGKATTTPYRSSDCPQQSMGLPFAIPLRESVSHPAGSICDSL